jgi:DNA repair protein RadC
LSIKIKELPELERPYEKLEMYGEKTLSNAELLAIIIKTGTKEETSVQLAQRLLSLNKTTKEDLNYLQTLSIEELMEVKGIGKVKAIQLKAVGEISARMFSKTKYKKMFINEPKDLAEILIGNIKSETNEKVKIAILNSRNQLLKIQDIASGGIDFVNIEVKEILTEPIKMKAPKYILVHNHPGESAKPSKNDIEYTKTLYKLSQLFNIELIDHIIIAGMNYTSIFMEWLTKEELQN